MFVSKTNVINVYKQDMDNFAILKRICNFSMIVKNNLHIFIYIYIYLYIFIYIFFTYICEIFTYM